MDSIKPIDLPTIPDCIDKIQSLRSEKRDFVVATLVHSLGSAPGEAGARSIISSRGLEFGTVGGGKIEARVISTAKELLSNPTQKCAFFQWNLQKDIGMTCGGVVSFFLEAYRTEASWKIAVFGAGHVSQELVRLLILLDCNVICIDSRPEWIDKLPFSPKLRTICTENMAGVISELHPETFITTMTMGHSTDLPILTQAMLHHSFPFLGTIGSEVKARVLKKDLKNAGVSESVLLNFQCPIGEDFGNNTPIEIAFSIVAQLLKERGKWAK